VHFSSIAGSEAVLVFEGNTAENGVFWVVTPGGSCWFLQEPNGVTTQKTPFFIVTAVKTSNLT
jgi:hypothetical protein